VATRPGGKIHQKQPERVVLYCTTAHDTEALPAETLQSVEAPDSKVVVLQPRGVGSSRWTRKNPPNYVERSHVLLGRTVDGGRVLDILSVARAFKEQNPDLPVWVAGTDGDALLAAYAALWSDDIAGVIAINPPASHYRPEAPQFLNIFRVADVPRILGALAPKPMTLVDPSGGVRPMVERIYSAAGAELR
jgi:pimeloyl-ACP methyl ester carboxylesterase